jgi:hypothetical protein
LSTTLPFNVFRERDNSFNTKLLEKRQRQTEDSVMGPSSAEAIIMDFQSKLEERLSRKIFFCLSFKVAFGQTAAEPELLPLIEEIVQI